MRRRLSPDMYDRSTRPRGRPCQFCGRPGRVTWHAYHGDQLAGSWYFWKACTRCAGIVSDHHMTPQEHDALMAKGCYAEGYDTAGRPRCERPPEHMDHDHLICPTKDRAKHRHHSCDKCRRGPLCRYHNNYIIKVLDEVRAGKHAHTMKILGLELADHGSSLLQKSEDLSQTSTVKTETCSICKGPLSLRNTSGACSSNPACRIVNSRVSSLACYHRRRARELPRSGRSRAV